MTKHLIKNHEKIMYIVKNIIRHVSIRRSVLIKLKSSLTQIAMLMLIFSINNAHATTYKANEQKRINIEISQSGVNRVEVKKDRIAKVIGNEGAYSIEGDNKTGVIFLSSNAIAGENLPITIITEKGFTQDINLKVINSLSPKTIIIEKAALKEVKRVQESAKDLKGEVIKAIREISRGEDRSFTRRDITLKEVTNYEMHKKPEDALNNNADHNLVYAGHKALKGKGISITKVTEYSNRKLKVIKYEYETKPSETSLKQISKLFKTALSISERGNVIMVVYQS